MFSSAGLGGGGGCPPPPPPNPPWGYFGIQFFVNSFVVSTDTLLFYACFIVTKTDDCTLPIYALYLEICFEYFLFMGKVLSAVCMNAEGGGGTPLFKTVDDVILLIYVMFPVL